MKSLIPLGNIVCIKMNYTSSLVINMDLYEDSWLDEMIKLGRFEIKSKDMLIFALREAMNQRVKFVFLMKDEICQMDVDVKKVSETLYLFEEESELEIITTLTYFDPETKTVGSTGHTINLESSGIYCYDLRNGMAYEIPENEIRYDDDEGEEVIVVTDDKKVGFGEVIQNYPYNCVIKPNMESKILENARNREVEIGEEGADILGEAQLWCDAGNSGKVIKYDIEIKACDDLHFIFKIKDLSCPELLSGMSGSPIIQNGKIIGAAAASEIKNPTNSIGIRIEQMLETDFYER